MDKHEEDETETEEDVDENEEERKKVHEEKIENGKMKETF